jgi:peptidoglycan/LPS O-acetylase OafA/YrhL
MTDHPEAQLVLHAALLQGIVPDSIWPYTSTAVLGPAWSLTLEWQFYLFAPALIWLLSRKSTWFGTAVLIIVGAVIWRGGYFGTYAMPTVLPMAAYIFLIGIVSRLYLQQLQILPLAPQFAVVIGAMGLLFKDQLWLAIWLAILVVLLQGGSWDARRFLPGAMHAALQSRVVQYLGARSYSVYLVHLPIIQVLTWLIVSHWPLSQLQLFFLLIALSVPVTLLTSDLLYRLVERPMIRLGARLAYGLNGPVAEPAQRHQGY